MFPSKGMTMEDVREFERKTHEETNRTVNNVENPEGGATP